MSHPSFSDIHFFGALEADRFDGQGNLLIHFERGVLLVAAKDFAALQSIVSPARDSSNSPQSSRN